MFLLFIYPNFCSSLFYYFFFVLSSILQTFFCFLLNSIFLISEKDHLIFGGLLGGFYFFLGSLTTHMVLGLWISSLAFLRVFRMFSGISALGLNSKITLNICTLRTSRVRRRQNVPSGKTLHFLVAPICFLHTVLFRKNSFCFLLLLVLLDFMHILYHFYSVFSIFYFSLSKFILISPIPPSMLK